jgi:hypothetical protein
MSEGPPRSARRSPPPERRIRGGRRAADRHYLAVVVAEARRLGRQLRPRDAVSAQARRPIGDEVVS